MKMKDIFSPMNSRPSTPPHNSNSRRSSAASASSASPPPSPPRITFSETIMTEKVETAEVIVKRWDLDSMSSNDIYGSKFPLLFNEDETSRAEARQFIDAVKDLQSAMHFFVKEDSSSKLLVRAQNLMEIAMKRLEREFYTILKTKRGFIDSESVSRRSFASEVENDETFEEDDDENENSQASENVIYNLRTIAECMINAGYGKECVYIYKLNRKSMVDEALYYLGIEKISSSQIQKMDWDALELKIKSWLTALKTCMRTLFHGERILCDQVFSASDKIRESCFSEIVKDNALTLFSFPENLSKWKKILSPERMFRFLDMYEAISELWIEIEVIFSFDSLSAVRLQAVNSLVKLGEAVRTMLSQFEAAIQKDSSKTPVSGGGVHPLTRYVMNYLVFLADYSGSVADIVSDWPVGTQSPLPEAYFSSPSSIDGIVEDSPASTITVRLAWLILVLLCKLDAKAGLYKEHVALSYLFLANNLNYVVSKVRNSNLYLLMGPEWISKHETKVKQYIANYARMGWSKVMTSFPDDPTADLPLIEIKDCFRKFNAGFEEAYRVQNSWVIPDSKLRDEVKVSLSKTIIPVYRVFYQKYRGVLGRGNQLEAIVRYAPEDLDNYLSDLFFGNGGSTVTTTRASYLSSSTSSSASASPSRGQQR